MLPTTHNIRRPAFWLVLTCLGTIAFFLLTDPRAGVVRDSSANAVDAARNAHVGTLVGIAGALVILCIALFLCTRKGSPPTGETRKKT